MKHDYSEQFNKHRINAGEPLSWIVTGLIIIVGLLFMFNLGAYI